MVLMGAALLPLAGWVVAVLLTAWWAWLVTRPVPAAPRPPADPYASDIAEFRRDLHDWDR